MLYLSRLIIDARSRYVRRDLGDCHQLHRTVLGAFPQAPAGAPARDHFGLLYRAEPVDGAPSLVRLLVQSNLAPDWTRLPTGYLGPDLDGRGNPAARPVSAEYERIQAGTRLVFRLRANPTKRIATGNTEQGEPWRGKRVELRREADQLAWLARKGERHGFRLLETAARPELPDVRASTAEKIRGRRPERDGVAAMPLRFGAVLFTGRLEVTDRAAFLAVLGDGIGSGKAFGFGLLSVAARQ